MDLNTHNQKAISRIHPEFIGISERFFSQKKQRLNIQKKKIQIELNKNYAAKLDQFLAKNLQKKMVELQKLQMARERHLKQIREKHEIEEKKRKAIEIQRIKNSYSRDKNKEHIQNARENLRKKNTSKKEMISLTLSNLNEKLEKDLEEKFFHNTMIYQDTKQDQKIGIEKVNAFYLEKNKQSLDDYKSRIKDENIKKKKLKIQMFSIVKDLKRYTQTIQLKKNYLTEVEKEIEKYSDDKKQIRLRRVKNNMSIHDFENPETKPINEENMTNDL